MRQMIEMAVGFVKRYKSIMLILLLILVCLLPMVASGYVLGIMCRILLYATLAGSLNVINGYSGQFNIGHAGFVCFGAYTGALCATRLNCPFVVQMLAGGIMAAAVAFFLSKPILRLKGIYLAIITMGFCEITRIISLNWDSVTGGAMGIKNIPAPVLFGIKFSSPKLYYFIFLFLLVVFTFLTGRILKSRVGRAWMSIREDDLAARSLGVQIGHYRSVNIMYGALWAGICGAAMGPYYRYIASDMFSMDMSFNILSMVILGGQGTLVGPILGAAIINVITEVFRFASEYRMVVYALLIIVMMWLRPQGLAGVSDSMLSGRTMNRKKGKGVKT